MAVGFTQVHWRYDGNADKAFSAGVRFYTRGEYSLAAAEFEKLLRLSPHQRTTSSYVMLGKSRFNLAQYAEAVKISKQFLDKHPESNYISDAHYVLSICYLKLRRYDDALMHALISSDVPTNPKLQNQALSIAERLSDSKLSIEELKEISAEVSSVVARDFINMKIGERYLSLGNFLLAEHWLTLVARRKPAGRYSSRASDALDRIKRGLALKIGALLPLKSSTGKPDQGEQFLSGMQLALEEIGPQLSSTIRITLDPRDTRRERTRAIQQFQELANDANVVAVLGPIFSDEAFAVGELATQYGVPLLSPTASADGVAALGRFVFQANPDLTTRGRAAARFSVSALGLTIFGILAPNEGHGKAIADAFAQELNIVGGRVAAYETYAENETDFREQFTRLRRSSFTAAAEPEISFARNFSSRQIMQMIEAGARPRVIDSLLDRGTSIGVTKLFGTRGRRIADSLGIKTIVREISTDSPSVVVAGIQALFVPIPSSEQIGIITSQMAYHGLSAQLLGTGEWNDPDELELHRRYADGVIFFSDSYTAPDDTQYLRIANTYQERYRRKPSSAVLFGFDAMNLVLALIRKGALTRTQLADELSLVENFAAIHSPITLSQGRVNCELHVLQYKGGVIKKIGEATLR